MLNQVFEIAEIIHGNTCLDARTTNLSRNSELLEKTQGDF